MSETDYEDQLTLPSRKMSEINTRNLNSYEFIVEEEKKPDLNFNLDEFEPKEIIEKFFKGENSFTEQKNFDTLKYSFETKESKFSCGEDIPLLEGYRMAYFHHLPIIINPNHFWLMVLQGFSKHMELNNNS